jgi:hypothetical protein
MAVSSALSASFRMAMTFASPFIFASLQMEIGDGKSALRFQRIVLEPLG